MVMEVSFATAAAPCGGRSGGTLRPGGFTAPTRRFHRASGGLLRPGLLALDLRRDLLPADHDGADQLVGEGLPLRVPQRPEVAEVAREAVQDVQQRAAEREPAAERLTRGLPDHADVQPVLAEARAGAALPEDLVPDPEPDRAGVAEDQQKD